MRVDRNWKDLMDQAFADGKFLCVGIDPNYDPRWEDASNLVKDEITAELMRFCISKIRAIGLITGFLKPNAGFFRQYGWRGQRVLEEVIAYTHRQFPNVAVILDMKVGDIGDTNLAYCREAFDELAADAITIHPYLGKIANQPFLNYTKKGIIVLCHTSNHGAQEFQHLHVGENDPLYLRVAENVATRWNEYGNCALVTGATYPQEIAQVRQVASEIPLLIPGIGKQGGDLKAAVTAAKRARDGAGFIINSSSGIFLASDLQKAAEDLHMAILNARH
ncbi:MAG: orotidine-5-phosphate decarboxylase [Candidatus Parcubacteria bacterium]|jgi:orotidine-5'-phosphate decarboxylase